MKIWSTPVTDGEQQALLKKVEDLSTVRWVGSGEAPTWSKFEVTVLNVREDGGLSHGDWEPRKKLTHSEFVAKCVELFPKEPEEEKNVPWGDKTYSPAELSIVLYLCSEAERAGQPCTRAVAWWERSGRETYGFPPEHSTPANIAFLADVIVPQMLDALKTAPVDSPEAMLPLRVRWRIKILKFEVKGSLRYEQK